MVMDDFERRVMKKKRQYLTEHLTADDKFIYLLRHESLIDIQEAVTVLDLKSNACRISKLVDLLCRSGISNIFNKFCHCLTNIDLTWLAKEMKTDLVASRGSNQIDDDVKLEAATLVHSKFGSSKRMSEGEKKQIQSIVAIKIQMAKDEWREEVESLRQQLHDYKINYYSREEKMEDIIKRTKRFLGENESSLVTMRHDMRSTTDTLLSAPEDGDIVASFKPILDDFFQRVIRIVKERDLFYSERQSIVQLLGIRDEGNSIVEGVRYAMTTREMKSSTIDDPCTDKDRRLADSMTRIDVLEARLLKQSDKLRSISIEMKGRCEAKGRDADYLTKGSRCRYKGKKRPDECLTASTSNISKLTAPLKTKSVFQTVTTKAGNLSPRRDRKYRPDAN